MIMESLLLVDVDLRGKPLDVPKDCQFFRVVVDGWNLILPDSGPYGPFLRQSNEKGAVEDPLLIQGAHKLSAMRNTRALVLNVLGSELAPIKQVA